MCTQAHEHVACARGVCAYVQGRAPCGACTGRVHVARASGTRRWHGQLAWARARAPPYLLRAKLGDGDDEVLATARWRQRQGLEGARVARREDQLGRAPPQLPDVPRRPRAVSHRDLRRPARPAVEAHEHAVVGELQGSTHGGAGEERGVVVRRSALRDHPEHLRRDERVVHVAREAWHAQHPGEGQAEMKPGGVDEQMGRLARNCLSR